MQHGLIDRRPEWHLLPTQSLGAVRMIHEIEPFFYWQAAAAAAVDDGIVVASGVASF